MTKILMFAGVILLSAVTTYAQDDLKQFSIKVVDHRMNPVNDAEVYLFGYAHEDKQQPKGKTDSDGIFNVVTKSTLLIEAMVKKEGYYNTRAVEIPKKYYRGEKQIKNSTYTITLKPIILPIPMYAKNLQVEGSGPLQLPEKNEDIGYDLMLGDWVAPYGKGKIKDFIFKHIVSEGEKEGEFEESISVKFSNAKDGLMTFESSLHKGSSLASSYKAPHKGYLPSWNQTNSRILGEPLKTNKKKNRNFYFRVRTKIDSSGNIVSCHYGKIYGDLMSFIYYFNPNPNDNNLEFDVYNNLFENLNWKEEVNYP